MSSEERRSAQNGIWLCQTCGKLVDNDPDAFPVKILRAWKAQAEMAAFEVVGRAVQSVLAAAVPLSSAEFDLLVAAAESGELFLIKVEQTNDWVEVAGVDFRDPVDPSVAASYLEALRGLISRGLVRRDAGYRYELTGTGFKVARRVAEFMSASSTA